MSVFSKATASRSKSLKSVLGGIAIVGVGALVLSGCAPTTDSTPAGPTKDLTLKIGTLLPQTGNLAFLGPPEEGGVALAVKEINEAKMGITIDVTYGDSGDPDDLALDAAKLGVPGEIACAEAGAVDVRIGGMGRAQLFE